jgi:hypothetical protein
LALVLAPWLFTLEGDLLVLALVFGSWRGEPDPRGAPPGLPLPWLWGLAFALVLALALVLVFALVLALASGFSVARKVHLSQKLTKSLGFVFS